MSARSWYRYTVNRIERFDSVGWIEAESEAEALALLVERDESGSLKLPREPNAIGIAFELEAEAERPISEAHSIVESEPSS